MRSVLSYTFSIVTMWRSNYRLDKELSSNSALYRQLWKIAVIFLTPAT